MICYAVIDTNVLVSALISKNDVAATVQLYGRLVRGEIIPVYSKESLNEYREVLSRKKFSLDVGLINRTLSTIEKRGIMIEPSPTGAILPDMKDLPFYEIVMEKRDDDAYLVTGNLKHFPKEPFIVTPRQMLDILDKNKAFEKIENLDLNFPKDFDVDAELREALEEKYGHIG
ncbi:MAG: putative toxin-antitoxin system toxin component, PIN family [Oscillospiraceae bacterium]|nr:putative toxin-antitoxin system toxin component, PIN family [Oscillospiraceae bacterium]